jgi:carboxyl-terminal processing protease
VAAKSPLFAALAALIIAACAVLGAEQLYSQRGSPHDPILAFNLVGRSRDFSVGKAGTELQNPATDIRILDYSFEKVRQSYYKPVNDADMLAGERKGLLDVLKFKHVTAQLPVVTASPQNDLQSDEAKAEELLRTAFVKYGSQAGVDALAFGAVSGMLAALKDPYTVFLQPREMRSLKELISGGDFGGIGVYIGQDKKTKQTLVIEPIRGTPAAKAGLKPGDIIVSVDGRATKGLGLDPVMNVIRGPAGSTVRLLVQRSGAPVKTYVVVREQIHVPSVDSKMLDNQIGYVQLVDFGDTSAQEVSDALKSLLARGAKGMILDLRNNGGGLLQAAVNISSKFVPDGPIVSTIDRQGRVYTDNANQDAIPPHPLAVLVNQFSASASEITAGAIQDSNAGVLIGVRTFGKGVVQTIYDLPAGAALKVTTARYVTPAGRDINGKGIQPNIVVPMDPRAVIVPAKDVQLKAAIGYLRRQIALNAK